MTDEKINVEFATELVAHMRERAKYLPKQPETSCRIMSDWSSEPRGKPFCGTVGCISGEATILAFKKSLIEELSNDAYMYGERWLGNGAKVLFQVHDWPDNFRVAHRKLEPGDWPGEMLLMADVLEDAVVRQQAEEGTNAHA